MVLREKWFRTLIHNISDIVSLIDAQGLVRFVNPRMETMLGYRSTDVLGRNIFDFIHPEDIPRATLEYSETLQRQGEGVPSVLRLRDIAGAWVPFEIIANNQLSDPEIQGVIFTARDVRYREEVEEAIRSANVDVQERAENRTSELAKRNADLRIENQARLHTEKQLQQAISLLNATLDATADGILVVSTEGKVSSCNGRFLEMWGIDCGSAIGQRDEDLLARALPQMQNSAEFLTKVKELYSSPEAISFDVLNLKDGRIFERYSQPQRIGERVVGRVWSFRDVTQARHMEKDLRQSQKMEAVGRLAGGVAHDFNNLLMLMSGYLGQLANDPALSSDHRSVIEQLLATTKRGASLTRQLLAFSRKDHTTPIVADLNAIVLNMEGLLRRLLSDSIRFEISLSRDPLYVFLDVNQIELAIMNLAVNAQDAMSNGGTLSISTRNEALAATEPSGKTSVNDYAVLEVADTGHGMTPDVQAHVFEPFFTTKEPGRGTGLGLATVYGIVERAQGQIKISSVPNQGTTLCVYLPQTAVAPGTKTADPEKLPAPRGHETILLAEDEAGIRAMTRTYLEGLGYRLLEAANGTEAIMLAKEYRGAIDLVLTDVMMPGVRGDAVVRAIRQDRPGIQAILISGFAEGTNIDRSLEILEKPFEFPDLARRIRTLLNRGRAGSSDNAAD
ncbi:MAG TPA: PAS domain S-box protein [Candidatus Angelobacter sp.]|jgi:PAS domain S-box-containing protein|nr:PAS domain S-box protein [Candidatus Angelobacter sp.]